MAPTGTWNVPNGRHFQQARSCHYNISHQVPLYGGTWYKERLFLSASLLSFKCVFMQPSNVVFKLFIPNVFAFAFPHYIFSPNIQSLIPYETLFALVCHRACFSIDLHIYVSSI